MHATRMEWDEAERNRRLGKGAPGIEIKNSHLH